MGKTKIDLSSWTPKTTIGKEVKAGNITQIDYLLDNNIPILEEQIVDALLPNLETDLLLIGQSKGKFGGGQRRVFRQTQRKTSEGNKPSFATVAIVGNLNGYVGAGYGKSRETVPAREKSLRNAKLRIFKISRGCGSWECGCREPHTIPFKVMGKCGSTTIILMPAPKGKGLVVDGECAKILRLAGIKDVWSKSFGQTRTKVNLIEACINALHKLMKVKLREEYIEQIGICEGPIRSA
ncbi:MAG: 30S ribosomal protein S5 [Nanoarchaeota archaeon]